MTGENPSDIPELERLERKPALSVKTSVNTGDQREV
jgi:hypothetical protein